MSGTTRISRAEREGVPYLFEPRAARNVKRLIEKAMVGAGWSDAGQGWRGKEAEPRLTGWSGKRRVIVPRRAVPKDIAVVKEDGAGNQLELYFGEIDPGRKGRVFEYAVLVTSLANEALAVARLYRDRADAGNVFDEVKNHWGWGGFETRRPRQQSSSRAKTFIIDGAGSLHAYRLFHPGDCHARPRLLNHRRPSRPEQASGDSPRCCDAFMNGPCAFRPTAMPSGRWL